MMNFVLLCSEFMILLLAESAEEDTVEQITVKFARSESERTKSLREKSYSFMLKKNAEEPWIDTKFYSSNADESKVTAS